MYSTVRTSLAGFVALTIAMAAIPFWTPQTSGVTARLRGVSAVSDTAAWASGTKGTILRTIDAGQNWQKLAIPETDALDFRDIDAMSDKVAYALSIGPGEASRIYKTTDGGGTWKAQFVNHDPKAFFDAMAFWNADTGVAMSDSDAGRFNIIATDDGGRTWTRVPEAALPPALPSEGAFAASGTNVATSGRDEVWIGTGASTVARVLHSADRGKTWTVAATPLAAGPSSGIFSVAFRDAQHGMVVGGDYLKELEAVDNAAVTIDGGKTWTLIKGLTGFRSVVAYVPGEQGSLIAVGPQGADYSTDDGRTWQPMTGAGYHAFSFAPSGHAGWGVGENGRIARLQSRRGLVP